MNGGSFFVALWESFRYNGFAKNKGDYFMSMQIVFEQILIIFGYVIVGYVAGKKNLITKEQQRYLSKLVSSLILPFTVLSASSMEASGQDIVNVAIAVALPFFLYGTYISWVYAVCKNKTGAGKKSVQPIRDCAHILIAPLLECLYVLR